MSKKKLKRVGIYAILLLVAAFFFIPIVWMISTSLKGSDEVFLSPPRWIPKNILWSNYTAAFEAIPYLKYLLNTLQTTGLAVIGNIISAPMIGYAFGKLRWPGRDKVFLLVIATMMLPFSVTMIPLYSMSAKFGWINTYIPLVLPDFLGKSYFIFLMRQFYMNLPDELLEAARIDGAGEFWVYKKIALPLVKPAIVTVALFSAVWSWTDFMGPLIYLNRAEKWTISLGLSQFTNTYGVDWSLLMAAAVIAIVPMVILFFCLQRYFIEGSMNSGIKG
ncbi:MAG: carbohydrate ABC transporter permease [Lachnospiraceae bacterium]|jgi:multiple sugar transport system permease protein|nr:carbohydrate ABC transporter permease [Lachnospiraceae bacterium]RKJ48799.1 carbohydrate ABC transporter permease [bacterium 1XD42-54]